MGREHRVPIDRDKGILSFPESFIAIRPASVSRHRLDRRPPNVVKLPHTIRIVLATTGEHSDNPGRRCRQVGLVPRDWVPEQLSSCRRRPESPALWISDGRPASLSANGLDGACLGGERRHPRRLQAPREKGACRRARWSISRSQRGRGKSGPDSRVAESETRETKRRRRSRGAASSRSRRGRPNGSDEGRTHAEKKRPHGGVKAERATAGTPPHRPREPEMIDRWSDGREGFTARKTVVALGP